jgi:hypothetical protein
MLQDRIAHRLFQALVGKPIVGNAFRGTLAEAIIAEALEPQWSWRADRWGAFDFEGPEGIGLEVKQSAARQDWHEDDARPCSARFDIRERLGYYDEKSRWFDAPGRPAAIYVFAHHPIFDANVADHRDPMQWDFYVLEASTLPTQKSIGLTGVRSRGERVGFSDLLAAVTACYASLPTS